MNRVKLRYKIVMLFGRITHQSVRRVPGAAQGGAAPPALLAGWGWPPFPLLVIREASEALIFYLIFLDFLEHF